MDSSQEESKTYTDAEVFGTLNAVAAERLSQKVVTALEKAVVTLPAIDDTRPVLDRLRTTYLKGVDVFELYGRRNIFTLDKNIPRSLRSKVAHLFLNTIDAITLLNDLDQTTLSPVARPTNVAEEFSLDSPIPTLTDIEQIRSNIEELQKQGDVLRRKKKSLQATVAEMSATSRLGSEVLDSLSIIKSHEPVLKLARELQETNAAAEGCRSRLEFNKRERDEDDDLEEIVPPRPNKSRPRKTRKDQLDVDQDIKLSTLVEFTELLNE